ncbi:E3 SUMO-protein ligase NSE2 [Heteronotia binoei]|uniref:E3 SUMO-protein ligase NSE2 n=1 Tax=Heteronotia binoei TaxID=13085 RepID=UPI00292F9BBA|nr:E3 SUMO-protein ligase NSE2 [Heteronotia binoei]
MPGGSTVSFTGMNSCLSSLKTCQSYISSGMDIATKVALDLVENHNDMEEVNEMEKVMLEYAAMSREVSHYVQAVEDTVNQIKREKPETLPDLEDLVQEKFTALERTNNDLELSRNEKFALFKKQLKQMKTQFGVQQDAGEGEALEQVDEDLAVTQSQMNFICPITQVEMKKPVRNKNCGHIYEEEAILGIITHKENQRKKAPCPQIGCNNAEVKRSDLVLDEVLKRAIDHRQSQHSQSTR